LTHTPTPYLLAPITRERTRSGAWLAALVCALLLTGCSDSSTFKGSDISDGKIGQGWSLVDHTGASRTSESFKGKVGLVFFGFTQCPDICPASLAEVSLAVSELGNGARDVQVLMISVDPERDTPEVLEAYLGAFDADLPTPFLGLTGSAEQIRQAASAFRAYYAKSPSPGGSYTMDHSTSFYLFDKSGRVRVLLNNQAGPDALTHDLRVLLKEP